MSGSLGKVKGFKNDKRNLLEATKNLIVFGQSQGATDLVKGRRPLQTGGGTNHLRKPSQNGRQQRAKSTHPPTGPEAIRALDEKHKVKTTIPRDILVKYFANTKPWINTSSKASKSSEGQSDEKMAKPGSSRESRSRSSRPVTVTRTKTAMKDVVKSVESAIFTNEIVCPICLKGFEPLQYSQNVPVSEIMKHSLAAYQNQSGLVYRKTLEEGWGAMTKPRCVLEPQDVVVSANCGELFHKLCLREWCARMHITSKNPKAQKPASLCLCPSCGKELKFTVFQEIECYRNFSDEPTSFDKELMKVKHTHRELQMLWPETNNYLNKLRDEIADLKSVYSELKAKRRELKADLRNLTAEDLSVVIGKVTDVDEIKDAVTKQAKALNFMEQETLQIMRMYLLTIMRKFKTGIKHSAEAVTDAEGNVDGPQLKQKLPERLIPYLDAILNNDELLGLLSRIIVPRVDDAKDPSKTRVFLELELLRKCEKEFPEIRDLQRKNTYTVLSTAVDIEDTEPEFEEWNNNSRHRGLSKNGLLPRSSLSLLECTNAAEPRNQARPAPSTASTYISESLMNMIKTCSATHAIPTNKVSEVEVGILKANPTTVPRPEGIIRTVKPPRLCRVVEIGESDIQINPSANFSAPAVRNKEPESSSCCDIIGSLLRTSSMDVAATSVPPTAVATSAPTSSSSLIKLSGQVKNYQENNNEVKKATPTVHPTPESSKGEIEAIKNSPLVQQLRQLVQKNNSRMKHICAKNVESTDQYRPRSRSIPRNQRGASRSLETTTCPSTKARSPSPTPPLTPEQRSRSRTPTPKSLEESGQPGTTTLAEVDDDDEDEDEEPPEDSWDTISSAGEENEPEELEFDASDEDMVKKEPSKKGGTKIGSSESKKPGTKGSDVVRILPELKAGSGTPVSLAVSNVGSSSKNESVEVVHRLKEIDQDNPSHTTNDSYEVIHSSNNDKRIDQNNISQPTNDSCELVYSQKNNQDQKKELITRRSRSESSLSKIPSGELSIAIMYIIEEEDESSENEGEKKQRKKNDKGQGENVLEPIYVTAEKASKFSLVAGVTSEGEVPLTNTHTSQEFIMNNTESYIPENDNNYYWEDGDEDDEYFTEDGGEGHKDSEDIVGKVKHERGRKKQRKLSPIPRTPRKRSSCPTHRTSRPGSRREELKGKNYSRNSNSNLLFRNKFGYKYEHMLSLPVLEKNLGSHRRRNVEPTIFIEDETLIKRRSQIYKSSQNCFFLN